MFQKGGADKRNSDLRRKSVTTRPLVSKLEIGGAIRLAGDQDGIADAAVVDRTPAAQAALDEHHKLQNADRMS